METSTRIIGDHLKCCMECQKLEIRPLRKIPQEMGLWITPTLQQMHASGTEDFR